MISAADPLAPSLVWTYEPRRRALLVRVGEATPPALPWTDSAGVRACDVIGLDAPPAEAKRALVEWREGNARRKGWVGIEKLASTAEIAGQKLAKHFSALLSAQRLEQKAVTTTESRVEARP